jgi:hypothetical protein
MFSSAGGPETGGGGKRIPKKHFSSDGEHSAFNGPRRGTRISSTQFFVLQRVTSGRGPVDHAFIFWCRPS